MNTEEMYDALVALVEKSEARIDKTNAMVDRLSNICERNTEIYDKHLTSLEESRDRAQENAAVSIEVSKNLSDLMAVLRKDYQTQLSALKNELHMMRDTYQKDLDEMRKQYKSLEESYRKLAENAAGNVSTVVRINQK